MKQNLGKLSAQEQAQYQLAPHLDNPRLSKMLDGVDARGHSVTSAVINEQSLTLYLNSQEIVTMMSLCDYPQYLALGYLLNQNMLHSIDEVEAIDYDEDLSVVVVRTYEETDFQDKLRKRTLTSGCAQGTAFGDLMETMEGVYFDDTRLLKTSALAKLLSCIARTPSLYLKTGAIHGCVLAQGTSPLIYMEDVGRHNAVDKIAGYMAHHNLDARDKIFFTTGRLTSEMVIKTAQMGIPVLVSRSGFTAWGAELAQKINLTLIGRAKGKRFLCLSGAHRLIFDTFDETSA